jgi:hypothetical protein
LKVTIPPLDPNKPPPRRSGQAGAPPPTPPPPRKSASPDRITKENWPTLDDPPSVEVRLDNIDDDDFERALAGLDLLGEEIKLDPDEEETAELQIDEGTPVPAPVAGMPSTRYSSIEAAVSALSRNEPDPSTVDFDGGVVGPRRKATEEVPIITEEEVERAATAPPPELLEIEETPEENGDFTLIAPIRVLYKMTAHRHTGLLVAKVGGIVKEIYFRDGMPEYVSSNMSSELFGNYLVQQGVLSSGELAMALAMMPHYGGKLGDTLVGLGLLKPLEVFRHLTRQVRQKLIDVCTWTKGFYSWYANRQNPREAFPLDLNAFEVLGAGAMEVADAQLDAWLERWRDARVKATKGRFGPERFQLNGLRALYDALDGRRTVSELLERYTDVVERRRAGRMLMLLDQCELLRQ